MEQLETKLVRIIAEALECDKTTIDKSSGLGKHPKWESLGQVSIIVGIEQAFNIEIKDEEIYQLLTFRELKRYIEKRLNITDN